MRHWPPMHPLIPASWGRWKAGRRRGQGIAAWDTLQPEGRLCLICIHPRCIHPHGRPSLALQSAAIGHGVGVGSVPGVGCVSAAWGTAACPIEPDVGDGGAGCNLGPARHPGAGREEAYGSRRCALVQSVTDRSTAKSAKRSQRFSLG